MEIQPSGYRVLIEIEEDEMFKSARKSGLVIASDDDKKERNMTDIGIVKAFGELAFSDVGGADAWCKIGDKVLFAKHGGHKVDFDGYDMEANGFLKVINDKDVFAVVKE